MKHLKDPKIVIILALLAFASVGYNVVYPLMKGGTPSVQQSSQPAKPTSTKQAVQNFATNVSRLSVADVKKMASGKAVGSLADSPLGLALEAKSGVELVRAINGPKVDMAKLIRWPGEQERDPFFPLQKKKKKAEKKAVHLLLSAIVIEPDLRYTVVNGRILQEGDALEQFIVEKIEKGKVTLSSIDGNKILKM